MYILNLLCIPEKKSSRFKIDIALIMIYTMNLTLSLLLIDYSDTVKCFAHGYKVIISTL